ncbi:TRM11 family SAM-dependent methyltransferase [Streptomyces litchfieldiae]|uniref:SAM-dependent methyltransferase n=1 Tax=Streptomyces litchfieldiae TaxID=3075543 RepID=A0ABU2MI56_9ACTN|nr:SAM-dependent methyltransferase [Streptomyces sp. DSM 44938]MDT0341098.1 SAM-dependent methyltransferase [Streptomyces sp. DSM 44938]
MNTYGLLLLPSHNRVYAQASAALAHAELLVLSGAVLGGRLTGVAETTLGGVPYLTFRADGLSPGDIRHLANLSSLYALFEIQDGKLLRPVELTRLDKFSSDLITIQKYPGKTNEDFTKLLLNVTAMSCATPERLLTGELRVLDPLCGRGTTLNQAMMYGLDAAGVERDTKSFESYGNFLRQWLKNNRVKHRAETTTVRRDRRSLGRRFHVALGESKELYKKGQEIEVTMVNADTAASGDFFRPASFDLIVTDAPYGVQHGATARATLSRSPLPLLRSALPAWTRLLRPGGAIGIAWNTYVARREELAGLLGDHGFEVPDAEPYHGFRHRVDQAIVRDLIVARRTAAGD